MPMVWHFEYKSSWHPNIYDCTNLMHTFHVATEQHPSYPKDSI